MRVIGKIDTLRFTYEEIKNLAEGCCVSYKSSRLGDYILYDRFLLAVRWATMTKDEIKL